MFFLGIAGPLLPYFLMIGILVAFTLEAGTGVLRKLEKENVDHHIRIAGTETETAAPEGLFYFNDRPDQSQDQINAKNASLFISGLLCPDIGNEQQIICRSARIRLADYVDCYFGLSPPYMDV